MTIEHIQIDWEVYQKMVFYCMTAPGEISGFGKADRVRVYDKSMYYMKDIRLLAQKCTSAHTSMDMSGLSSFIIQLDKEKDNIGNWRVWWHTHNDFGVFFSGEDEATIKKLCAKRHLISICINKLGEMTARFDIGNVTRKLTVVCVPPSIGGVYRDCVQEVQKKVKIERVRSYGYIRKRGVKEEILEAVGLGESAEDIEFESYLRRSGGDRKLRDTMSFEDGMRQYYGI